MVIRKYHGLHRFFLILLVTMGSFPSEGSVHRGRVGYSSPSCTTFQSKENNGGLVSPSSSSSSRRHSLALVDVVTTLSPALSQSSLWDLRGGSQSHGSDDEDDDDEEDDDDLVDESFFGFDDMDDVGLVESDFQEATIVDRMVDAWKKTPPFTQAYLAASFAATLYGYFFNRNEFPSVLLLDWKPVLQRLQIWRLFTSFLNFGPLGLGYLMTAQFVWTYMSTLERLNHDRPYDFWIMVVFGQLSMVLGYPIFKLSPRFLGHNLSTFFVYIWSRYHEGIEVNMFELFNTRAELLPWFFLAQTFLLEGELPVLDFLGIVFGHIYHHCKTVGILRAPDSLVTWYNGDSKWATQIREKYKPISSDFGVA